MSTRRGSHPRAQVDQVWHTFLEFPGDYRDFCANLIGAIFDLNPLGAYEPERDARLKRTKERSRQVFGVHPHPQFWDDIVVEPDTDTEPPKKRARRSVNEPNKMLSIRLVCGVDDFNMTRINTPESSSNPSGPSNPQLLREQQSKPNNDQSQELSDNLTSRGHSLLATDQSIQAGDRVTASHGSVARNWINLSSSFSGLTRIRRSKKHGGLVLAFLFARGAERGTYRPTKTQCTFAAPSSRRGRQMILTASPSRNIGIRPPQNSHSICAVRSRRENPEWTWEEG